MDLLYVVVLIFYDSIVLTKAETCRCLQYYECVPESLHHFIKNTCLSGCKPGWNGIHCDRIATTTTRPCHCLDKSHCGLYSCGSCEYGWHGLRCDRYWRNTDTSHKSDNSEKEAWSVLGFLVLGIFICSMLCFCICPGLSKKRREQRSESHTTHTEPMWSTESSASAQIYSPNRNTMYSPSDTDAMDRNTTQLPSLQQQTVNETINEPPPSYESVMSKTTNGFDTKITMQVVTEEN